MTSACIVTYKTNLEELQTVLQCTADSSMDRVWVVDNSPTNELEVCTQWSPKIEYIFGQGNVGYGTAHNIAIRKSIESGAKYHVVINPDIYFDPSAIASLQSYMDKHPEVGQVMPKIVYPNGEIQYLCKLLPSPYDLFGRRFLPIKSVVRKRNYIYEMRASGYQKEMFVPFLSGCFMFMRVEALAEVNGFDDDFFMYCEDLDLCRRISQSGYQTMFFPNANVVHAHKKESFKSKVMLKAHIKSAIHYFNKWGWFCDSYAKRVNKTAKKQY